MNDYIIRSEPQYDETGSYIVISPAVEGCDETDNILFSLKAVQIIDDIRLANKIPLEFKVRISTVGGTKNGRMFTMLFDNIVEDGDRLLYAGDFSLLVDSHTLFFLMGARIDYIESEERNGFIFDTNFKTEVFEIPDYLSNN
jgi:Fe-S cluster assembly iron-binding protein IscA